MVTSTTGINQFGQEASSGSAGRTTAGVDVWGGLHGPPAWWGTGEWQSQSSD